LYLADRGWSEFRDQIVRTLLPALGPELTERLLRRATELGQPDAVRDAVSQLLGPDGQLGSWAALSDTGNARLLTRAAVLAPGMTITHVAGLMARPRPDQMVYPLTHSGWSGVATPCVLRLVVETPAD